MHITQMDSGTGLRAGLQIFPIRVLNFDGIAKSNSRALFAREFLRDRLNKFTRSALFIKTNFHGIPDSWIENDETLRADFELFRGDILTEKLIKLSEMDLFVLRANYDVTLSL